MQVRIALSNFNSLYEADEEAAKMEELIELLTALSELIILKSNILTYHSRTKTLLGRRLSLLGSVSQDVCRAGKIILTVCCVCTEWCSRSAGVSGAGGGQAWVL